MQEIAQHTLRKGLEAYDRRHGYRGAYLHFETLDDWRTRLSQVTRPLEMLDHWSLGLVLDVSAEKATLGFSDETIPNGSLNLANVEWARAYIDGYARGPEITAVSDVVRVGDVIMVRKSKYKDM